MSTTTETSQPAAVATPAAATPAPAATPRVRRPRPQVMSVTPAAAERVKALIDGRGKPTAGIRIGVRTKGCSGIQPFRMKSLIAVEWPMSRLFGK